jgi:hypothetical protein
MQLSSKNNKRQFPKISKLAPLLKFELPSIPTRKKRLAAALTILHSEMVRNMKLLGVNSPQELAPKHVRLLPTHAGLGSISGGK